MNLIYKILLAIVCIVAFALAGYYGAIRQEKHDCYVLQEQSKEYTLFYITKTGKEMCNHYSIPVNAPVK
jgi:hypothetical protein